MSAYLQDLLQIPRLQNLADLSQESGISPSTLNGLIWYPSNHYFDFKIPKRSGGFRRIHAPSPPMKAIQAWILRSILVRLSPSVIATAYREGKSIRANAAIHEQNRYFFKLDIKDFFPSVNARRVRKVFSVLGYTEGIVEILEGLCTHRGQLPQGGVTSPHLANLVCLNLDKRLLGISAKLNLAVSRYADDIVVSGNDPRSLRIAAKVVARIVRQEGFDINTKKVGFYGPDRKCEVTGLVKNASQPRFGIGRKKFRQIRSMLFRISQGIPLDAPYRTVEQVDGLISYVKSVDQPSWIKLTKYAQELGIDHCSLSEASG